MNKITFRNRSQLAIREVCSHYFLVDAFYNRIFRINPTSKFILEELFLHDSIDLIISNTALHFNVDSHKIRNDIHNYIKHLKQHKVINTND